ncbi:MAG: hypothetical protein K6E47_11840 [Lachnospiraceae bacterium]|nr:hypothetical protein [Lachnospiraceae bacterium]
MKKRFILSILTVLCLVIMAGCTEKSQKDADKLTSDIVDYAQNKVDEAIQYSTEHAGDLSEMVVEGLNDVAHIVKDEAEDLAGAVKDDLEGNIKEVIDETKDSINSAKEEIKEDINGAKEDIGNDVNDAVDQAKKYIEYKFRNNKLLNQHYEKHGIEMGFDSKESYEKAASDVINNPDALHKIEKEDGDFVYYVEATNEFVILSQDGYIRTYFLPSAGKKYYDRQ